MSLAQTVVDHSPDSKDVIDHDPSLEPQLGLGKVIEQKKFSRTQIARGIFYGEYLRDDVEEFFRYKYNRLVREHPDWFDLLSIHEDRYVPKLENGPTAINTNFEYQNISRRDYGYCWGFATLIRNFAVLAFYDPWAQPKDDQGKELRKNLNRAEWTKFYMNKISDILIHGKATVIPGFSNFREFSLVPEFELELKLQAMRVWRRIAVNRKGLGVMARTHRNMTPDQSEQLLQDLDARLKRHEFVKLSIASLHKSSPPFDFSKRMHVVLAYELVRLPNGGAKVKVWDGNFYAETLAREPKSLEFTADGRIIYQPWQEFGVPYAAISNRLARVEVSPENDAETVEHVFELKKFCAEAATSKYCN